MVLIRRLQEDPNAEREGVWFDIEYGIRLKVASTECPEFKAVFRNYMKKNIRKIRLLDAEALKDESIMKGMAKHLLLDWENITEEKLDENGQMVLDEKGQPIEVEVPHSIVKAFEYIKSTRNFRETVYELAGEETAFRLEEQREAEGNS